MQKNTHSSRRPSPDLLWVSMGKARNVSHLWLPNLNTLPELTREDTRLAFVASPDRGTSAVHVCVSGLALPWRKDYVTVKVKDSGLRLLGFESWLQHFLAVCFNLLAPLYSLYSHFIYILGIMTSTSC